MPSWLAVAKNEYRLMLSGKVTRRLRKPLPFILSFSVVAMGALLSLVSQSSAINFRLKDYLQGEVAPSITFGAPPPFFVADTFFIWTMAALAGFFTLFLPIFSAFGRHIEEVEVVSKDILLSSPLKPIHVIVGGYVVNLTLLPIILIISAVMLIPAAFKFYLPPQTVALIFAILALANATGIWIAVLISTYLFTRELTGKTKSILKILLGALGVAFSLIILFLLNSTASIGLWFLPPVWIANAIHFAVTQSNVAVIRAGLAYLFVPLQPDGWTSVALVAALSAVSFLVGAVYSSRISFTSMVEGKEETLVVEKENVIYRTLKRTLSYPLGVVAVSHLKEFTRRTDRLIGLASIYIFPIIVFFITRMTQSDAVGLLLQISFMSSFYITMACTLMPIMVVSYIFVGKKELLMMIKKAPSGVRFLVYSMFAETLFLSVPASILLALMFYLVMSGLGNLLSLLAMVIFAVTVSSATATGVYASRPVFKEKGFGHLVNFVITFIVTGIVIWVMIFILVMPWIPNLMAVSELIEEISKFPQLAGVMANQVLVYLAVSVMTIDPRVQLAGAAASVLFGLAAMYVSLKVGIRRLERYEG